MSDTETKARIITITDAPPLRITDSVWPLLASGSYSWHDNEYEFQANRKAKIFVKVRQHADGRSIVYAGYDYDSAWQNEENAKHRTGELVDIGGDLVAALKRVTRDLAERAGERHDKIRDCLNECIADLPAVDLDSASHQHTYPRVNLNGTSRDLLIALRINAAQALDAAINALTAAEPQPRDYQGAPAGAFDSARDLHVQRLAALQDMRHEQMREVEYLQDGGAQ